MSPLFFKRLSDEILGSRLASGEAAAFDELYRRYSNKLAAYGSHLLGDAGLGDDVAQATMLKAYGALREGRVPQRMKPWLFRIAHNVAIDLVVRRREFPSEELPESPSIDREPFAGTLVEALATLPDRQRRVYVLREVHGLRIDETAAELGLTAGQVEQSLFAARNRLAEQLVFGDRLNCVTVQRLAAGPLDSSERRALKTHLRTCTSCRSVLGMRGRALSLFPVGMSLEWLPRLGAGLLTGGAPAAAKMGAVVATATIAASVPVAVETVHLHAHRPTLPRVTQAHPAVVTRDDAPVALASADLAPVAHRPTVLLQTVSSQTVSLQKAPAARTHPVRHAPARARTRPTPVQAAHRGSRSSRDRSGHRGSGDEGGTLVSSEAPRGSESSRRRGDSGDSGRFGQRDGPSGEAAPTVSGNREGGDHLGSTGGTTSTVQTESLSSGGGGDGNDGSRPGGDGSGSGGGGGDASGSGGRDSHGGDGGGGGGDDDHTTTTATTTTSPTTTTTSIVPAP